MTGLHPWWPDVLPTGLSPHIVFEALAYLVGLQLFLLLRRRGHDPVHSVEARIWIATGAVLGALVGSKVLFFAEDLGATWAHRLDPGWLVGGKSIVGGLLGGLVAVELTKKLVGVRHSTGDVLVAPLIVGMCIGRLGCYFAGVTDGTHGLPTSMPWGMDLGDGVLRHPTALYEIGVLALLGIALLVARPPWRPGARFAAFMVAYLAWRLGVETIKTQPFPYLGFSAIQLACVAGLLYYGIVVLRWRTTE